MTEWINWIDGLGPQKIMHVYDPDSGMKGVAVIHTTAFGSAAGGIRMLPDITTEEIALLAKTMTYKNGILGSPMGGAKAGIWADPGLKGAEREKIMTAFGRAMEPLISSGLILGADIGTNGHDVMTVYEAAGRHRSGEGVMEKDGEPLENLVTGYGVFVAAKEACEMAGLDLNGATVAIEGFGKVGGGVARYLDEAGAKVAAVSTVYGAVYNESGLNVKQLLEMRKSSGDMAVQEYKEGTHLDKEEIFTLPVDILMPGARPYVIDSENAGRIKARVISSSANIPISEDAEEILFKKGIVVVPDFISNAGGVLVHVVHAFGGTTEDVFTSIRRVIGDLTREVLSESSEKGINPRNVAVNRVNEAIKAAGRVEALPSPEEMGKLMRERLKF